uniref:Uncharacterized protein n=1 Tax=Rhizophagus irregularis (strain DAOM 181602 / DAOM 197198 / MUCL 43194) TaxID=747089 RepID=U9TSN6_RHIID
MSKSKFPLVDHDRNSIVAFDLDWKHRKRLLMFPFSTICRFWDWILKMVLRNFGLRGLRKCSMLQYSKRNVFNVSLILKRFSRFRLDTRNWELKFLCEIYLIFVFFSFEGFDREH